MNAHHCGGPAADLPSVFAFIGVHSRFKKLRARSRHPERLKPEEKFLMIAKHKEVFFQAAEKYTCWIGLREPNPLSDQWIGIPGGMPKSMDCKAKTADNPTYRFAGLVVDPTVCPQGFKTETIGEARHTWKEKFLHGDRLPGGFNVVDRGVDRGVVMKNGARIFADFDLMLINRSNGAGEFLFTSEAEQETLFDSVQPAINQGLGVPMIQHGAEFMWKGGVGARESEVVLFFGPGRRFKAERSSMPKNGH